MAAAYKLLRGKGVLRVSDGVLIPQDMKNRDWRDYQIWLAGANTPDAADVPEPVISASAFFERFTDAERLAVQTACNANVALGVGLVNGLALGQITLNSVALKTWMDGLVSAGALTAEREAVLIAP